MNPKQYFRSLTLWSEHMKLLHAHTQAPQITAETRPERADILEYIPPSDGADSWVLTVEGVPAARASAAVTELVKSLDGNKSVDELYPPYADQLTMDEFIDLLERFQRIGVISGGNHRVAGRLAFRPPLTVQFASMSAPKLFTHVAPGLRLVFTRAGAVIFAVIAVVGLVLSVLQLPEILGTLSRPVSMVGILAVTVVLITATAIHEFAHGLALACFGATPRRAGFMLFYLAPAFFVDVTDGWRLASRWQRVAVALAGPAAHVIIGSITATIGLMVSDEQLKEICWILTAACFSVVAFNLIPFVRFDGYLALMTALDQPNLRSKAMSDAGSWIGSVWFGAPQAPRRVLKWWSVPFGMASAIFPMFLILSSVGRLVLLISGQGPLTGILVLCIEVLLLVLLIRWFAASFRHLNTNGARPVRVLLTSVVICAAVIAVGFMIKLPTQVRAGFVNDAGSLNLVQSADAHRATPEPGQLVDLKTSGLIYSTDLGQTRIASSEASIATAEISTLFPIEVPGTRVDVVQVPLESISGTSAEDLPASGVALIRMPDQNLWSAAFETFIGPALKDIAP